MSVVNKTMDKALKALKIPSMLKDAVSRVLNIKPQKVIVIGMNTATNQVTSAGAGDINTTDAMAMISGALSSVYLELPPETRAQYPINTYLTTINTIIINSVRSRDPNVILEATVPTQVETVEPQVVPEPVPLETETVVEEVVADQPKTVVKRTRKAAATKPTTTAAKPRTRAKKEVSK